MECVLASTSTSATDNPVATVFSGRASGVVCSSSKDMSCCWNSDNAKAAMMTDRTRLLFLLQRPYIRDDIVRRFLIDIFDRFHFASALHGHFCQVCIAHGLNFL